MRYLLLSNISSVECRCLEFEYALEQNAQNMADSCILGSLSDPVVVPYEEAKTSDGAGANLFEYFNSLIF